MDIVALIAMVLGVGAILLGNVLEGGHTSSLIQPTAALIIGGGTLAATLLSFTTADLKLALRLLPQVVKPPRHQPDELIRSIVALATKTRREGLLALEQDIRQFDDPFLTKGLELLVDGVEAKLIREVLETEIATEEEYHQRGAKVFEAGGGYSPTIGIVGAVLGLIHVMNNLSDPAKLGPGIATAFVATIYGLVLANLFLIPIGSKLKLRGKDEQVVKELMLQGVLAVQAGLNPRLIEEQLHSFLRASQKKGKAEAGSKE